MDLTRINACSVLHAVDCATNFDAAKFLNRENGEEVRRTFEQM